MVAARAALRVLPLAISKDVNPQIAKYVLLPGFRATAIARFAALYLADSIADASEEAGVFAAVAADFIRDAPERPAYPTLRAATRAAYATGYAAVNRLSATAHAAADVIGNASEAAERAGGTKGIASSLDFHGPELG